MPQNETVVDIFEQQVSASANKLAIRYGETTLTYRQLDERSNQLAHLLIAKGVTIETLVPVCLHRSVDIVVAVWGILKAGAAYVPVDPEFPLDRIRYMVEDTSATLIIADGDNEKIAAATTDKVLLPADNDWDILKGLPATAPGVGVKPHNLAYIIYTSGSTGKPKGVLIQHDSLLDYISGLFARLPYPECRSYALGVSFAADSVITHLFGSLTHGAELHLFTKEDYNNVDYIHDYFARYSIDCLKAVPSHWKSLSRNGVELLPRKILMFGGEALYTAMIRAILPVSARPCILVNHYGPTETTVGQLLHVIEENGDYGATIPIGKPFTDARDYILGETGNPVADGETGELYIGGTCVARGYLNRPELTEQRFVADKFSEKPESRLYRTGDLVRRLPSGDVEFLGRIDDQVKIRGYRIELGEVENILAKAPGVKQSVVLAKTAANGDTRLIGYVVCSGTYDRMDITRYLETQLPDYMVPRLLVPLGEMPFFPNGKVDKRALPNPDASALLANNYVAPAQSTEHLLAEIWKETLAIERAGTEDNFFELGGNSLLAQKTVALLKKRHDLVLPVVKLYQFPRIKDLAAFLDGRTVTRKAHKSTRTAHSGVAVISMAGRFPGADSVEELWDVLRNGKETTTFFTPDELDPSVSVELRNNPNYVKARGVVRDIKHFDAAFFGITPRQAELMDPQQRVFLEIAWEALEKSGHVPGKFNGNIGVFAGVRYNTYLAENVLPNEELVESVGRFQVITLNDKDYVASRTAYALDLKGPAVNVQSACSTTLLAIAQAVESIRNGHCDMALAGGATLNAPPNVGHLYEEGAMLSNDGHCRPFDAGARGTVFSDGAGVVLLRNLEDAIKDGDNIIAVVKGVGMSNDGGGKGSFTAPSAEGQAAAISMAINDAGIAPEQISYIETHGTATPLGDPIEIEGLNIAFGSQEKKQFCALGSVKSNFGHLTTTAGVAGFIKACLAMQHRQIPPTLHFTTPNPEIDFETSPFYVCNTLTDWKATEQRLAGVSSFGVGGTNVHVILEEYQQQQVETTEPNGAQLFCWSARSEQSVNLYKDKLTAYFAGKDDATFADAAYTLHTARAEFGYRKCVVAANAADIIQQAAQVGEIAGQAKALKEKARPIVFLFPGQGDQYVNMGRSLFETQPVFRQAMVECAGLLRNELGLNILDIIYPAETGALADEQLRNTAFSQPALFSIGYALGKMWMNWGIYPAAFAGHSIGEFVAAYFSGVFSLADALKLIAARGRLMADLPRGSMLSVRLGHLEVQQYLVPGIDLAAANSPQLSVLAGSNSAINELQQQLEQLNIPCRLLPTSHAFHSSMMDAAVEPFRKVVAGIQLNEPLIPIMSTVTGSWLTAANATDPGYWAGHLRATVYFGNAIQALLDSGWNFFLELGPARSVSTLARQQAAGKPLTVIASMDKNEADAPSAQSVLRALGQLWVNGAEPDWTAFYQGQKRKKLTDLPTYAFNRKLYWVNPPVRVQHTAAPIYQHNQPTITETGKNIHELMDRKPKLITQIKDVLENAFGLELGSASPEMSFIELGLDSLLLTQFALLVKKQFAQPVTFRQLNEELGSLALLAAHLDAHLPPDPVAAAPMPQPVYNAGPAAAQSVPANATALDLISRQIQLLAAQVALIQGGQPGAIPTPVYAAMPAAPQQQVTPPATNGLSAEEEAEIKKPFGAAARIEKQSAALAPAQQQYLAALTEKYNAKTRASKAYTQQHRAKMADPRVVSGFRPATKELVYSVVMNRSKGSRLWDIDGNEYIDALNGFGSNLLGYQPDVLTNALKDQIDKGYEIGPQHELAGEVCDLICEFTGFDRSALCNTGSEAVLGAMRIARTVTGRSKIVAFAGSYHGITDEVIARGTKKHKTFPASPGIMPEAVQNMLILDYGTDESLRIIEEQAHELAAVLVEPVQSRRCDFQPIAFLKKLREITARSGTVLVFDEVISGFRFHPGGTQAMFGIRADLGTYGKVVGGGLSIGVVAGHKKYMDSLDGGWWQYGDDSIPEVGVTYFAGTFVRHPLALAAAKASLLYFKQRGPALQEELNAKGKYIADSLNAFCRKQKIPVHIANFCSLWRMKFLEEYPYMELFFILMRLKGIHIIEGFPCFMTEAHTNEDIKTIIRCFEESMMELRAAGLIPEYQHQQVDENILLNTPPVPGAKLGKDRDGNPAWFVMDENNPGKYLQVVDEITNN